MADSGNLRPTYVYSLSIVEGEIDAAVDVDLLLSPFDRKWAYNNVDICEGELAVNLLTYGIYSLKYKKVGILLQYTESIAQLIEK